MSRTQYQYTLEDADPRRAEPVGAASWSTGCSSCPELRDVASDQQDQGLQALRSTSTATPPRRLGITPQLIDDTLYDAFGQRQVSTIFTQSNQYRVVLEVEARVPAAVPTR